MSNTLPQLDTTYFASQAFWLGLSFVVIYAFIYFWFVPTIQKLFVFRQKYISNLQKELEELTSKLQILEKEYSTSVAKIHQQAEQLKQNAIYVFEKEAQEQALKTNLELDQRRESLKEDIRNWQINIEKDVQKVGFDNIKYLIKKSVGIDIK